MNTKSQPNNDGNQTTPTCPLCDKPLIYYAKIELHEYDVNGYLHMKYYCNCGCSFEIEELFDYKKPFSQYIRMRKGSLARFSARPVNAWEKAWRRMQEIILFALKHGADKTLYDAGYKAGLRKVVKEAQQIEKEIKG